MIFDIILFVLSWICFAMFAEKKRFIQLAPTCYMAMYWSAIFSMVTRFFTFWIYPAPTKVLGIVRNLLQDFGVYPVVTYLFLQSLPKQQTVFSIVRHIFYWSLVAIVIELASVKTGNMRYSLGWNTWCSYLADWVLYGIFYGHHKWHEKHTGGES